MIPNTNIRYSLNFAERFRRYSLRRHLTASSAATPARGGRERRAIGRDGRPQRGPVAKEGLVPRRRNRWRLYLLVNHLPPFVTHAYTHEHVDSTHTETHITHTQKYPTH